MQYGWRFVVGVARAWRLQQRDRQFIGRVRFSRDLIRQTHAEFVFET